MINTLPCGGIQIDACRVGTSKAIPGSGNSKKGQTSVLGKFGPAASDHSGQNPNIGRFPANLILGHRAGCCIFGVKEVKVIGSCAHRDGQGNGGMFVPRGSAHDGYVTGGKETIVNWVCAEGCAVGVLDAKDSGNVSRFFKQVPL